MRKWSEMVAKKICFTKNAKFSRNVFSFSLETLDETLNEILQSRVGLVWKIWFYSSNGDRKSSLNLTSRNCVRFLSYFYIIILGQSNCDYSPQTRDQYIIYTDKSLSSFSSASCKQSCTQERDFNCRSYSFLSETRSGDPQCLLSSDTQKSAGGKFQILPLGVSSKYNRKGTVQNITASGLKAVFKKCTEGLINSYTWCPTKHDRSETN